MGVSRPTFALALEAGGPSRLRSPYIPQKFKARPMHMKYMLGLNTHKRKQKNLCRESKFTFVLKHSYIYDFGPRQCLAMPASSDKSADALA